MKTFKLFFGFIALLCVSFTVSAQNLDDDDDLQVSVGVAEADIAPGIHLQLPNNFVLRGGGSSFLGRNFSVIGSTFSRLNTTKPASSIIFPHNGGIKFFTQNEISSGAGGEFWQTSMHVQQDGKVLIGTANTSTTNDYKLYVQTGILTEKLKVASVESTNWADYVFEEDYNLNPIEEVEAFIKTNKHLPNVPSAQEVEANGVEMVEMDATLLRQVEELWLHTIDLNKDKETLKEENATLSTEVEALQTQNEELTEQVETLTEQFELLLNKVKVLETQNN